MAKWSSEGSRLFVGAKDKGVQVYRNTLTPADGQVFVAIQRALNTPPVNSTSVNVPASKKVAEPRKIPALAQFTPSASITQAKLRAQAGAKSSTQEAPPRGEDVPLYIHNTALANKTRGLLSNFKVSDAGLTVYQLKEILKESPDYIPAQFALGYAQYANNNPTEALRLFLGVVRADAGQSTLTSESLCFLGIAYLKAGHEPEALDCLATGLLLDKDHAETRQQVAPLMQKYGIAFRAPVASDISPANSSPVARANLPKLSWPAHRKSNKSLSAEELFGIMAQRTVSIKTDRGYGSGVFITDDGFLLTNEHVIQGQNNSIEVTMFSIKNGKVEKAGVSRADVVFADRENDVAVLKVNQPSTGSKALSLCREDPPTGLKVFAIGSPGLGDRVLEQSLTEGLISSNQRVLDGQRWYQHSAAINPGNSGGPLMSQSGEIVGMVTLKADMENVGFAIPATRIREILGQPSGPTRGNTP